jgi:hypothetical protein
MYSHTSRTRSLDVSLNLGRACQNWHSLFTSVGLVPTHRSVTGGSSVGGRKANFAATKTTTPSPSSQTGGTRPNCMVGLAGWANQQTCSTSFLTRQRSMLNETSLQLLLAVELRHKTTQGSNRILATASSRKNNRRGGPAATLSPQASSGAIRLEAHPTAAVCTNSNQTRLTGTNTHTTADTDTRTIKPFTPELASLNSHNLFPSDR